MRRHSKQLKIYIASFGEKIAELCEDYLLKDVSKDTEHHFTNTLLNLSNIFTRTQTGLL